MVYLAMVVSPKRLTDLILSFHKNMKNIGLAIVGGLFFLLLSGQAVLPSTSDAKASLQEGNQYWRAAKYAAAYIAWRAAQRGALLEGDSLTWAIATRNVGKYLVQETKVTAAEATLDSVLALAGRWDSLHPVIVKARLSKATLAMMQSDLEGAQAQYRALLGDMRQQPATADSLIAMAYQALGGVLFWSGRFDSATAYCQKALSIYDTLPTTDPLTIANSYNTLGGISLYSGKTEAALGYYLKTSTIREQALGEGHPEVIKVKTNIGVVYGEMGLYWESLAAHEQNLPYLDSLPPLAHANGLLNLGSTYIAVGNYGNALAFFDQAENWLDQHPGLSPDAYPYMNVYRSTVYQELDQLDSALKYIDRALRQNRALFGERNNHLTVNYMQLGSLLSYMEDYEGAIEAFEKVLSLEQEFIGEQSLRGAHTYYYMGEVYAKKREPQQALTYSRQAFDMYHAIGNTIDKAQSLVRMASSCQALGDWETAFVHLQEAWKAQLPEFAFELVPTPHILKYWRRHQMSDVFEAQVSIYHTQYEATKDTSYLHAALASAEIALAVIDSLRHYHPSPGAKQVWLEEQLPLYERAVEFAYQLAQYVGNEAFVEKVFILTEKRKAHNLQNHLRGVEAIKYAGVPDSLTEKVRYFRQRLASVDAQLAANEEDKTVQQSRFELNQSYQTIIRQIANAYPQYHQLTFAKQPLTAHEISQYLADDQALYSYLWGASHIYITRWFQGKGVVYKILQDSNFTYALNKWMAFISQPPDPTHPIATADGHHGAFLANVLLPELTARVNQVVVIPDGKLGYLPFESLLFEEPPQVSYRQWPYLARNWSMTYAYAAELWYQQQKNRSSTEPASYQGFAPDFSGTALAAVRSDLGALSHNQAEVQQVAQLLGGKASLGSKAQESLLKSLGEKSSILHFATHAIADDEHQVNSRLYLASSADSADDGILHAYEIYGLQLNSPLTVLSACQTGKGPILSGEGIMSLARAFQYSGSQRVLTTLWKTDDRAGAALTTSFFEGVATTVPTATALQQARMAWLEEADNLHCHPYYWAGYVLIGDGGKVTIASSRISWIWGVLGLLVMLGGGLFWWKRRK